MDEFDAETFRDVLLFSLTEEIHAARIDMKTGDYEESQAVASDVLEAYQSYLVQRSRSADAATARRISLATS